MHNLLHAKVNYGAGIIKIMVGFYMMTAYGAAYEVRQKPKCMTFLGAHFVQGFVESVTNNSYPEKADSTQLQPTKCRKPMTTRVSLFI